MTTAQRPDEPVLGTMNTQFTYMLRDAANYKTYDEVVFAGEITDAEREVLSAEAEFLPEQIGLTDLTEQLGGDYEDDSPWHEVFRVEATDRRPEANAGWEDIHQFVEAFRTTVWDDGTINETAIEEAARESGDIQDRLDELVHDVVSKQATEINNGGAAGQARFLVEHGFGRKELHEVLGIPLDDRDQVGA